MARYIGGKSELPPSFPTTRYAVEELIGEGSRKRVFCAHDNRLDRAVAIAFIKTDGLDELALARVHREAREMGRLGDHPNIVTVYDIGEADGELYIVTQFMAGGDIKHTLDGTALHRLPIVRAIEIAEQVCSALEHAHARGVVHRDVKPGNVWLTDNGIAHLGDFGLAFGRERIRLTSEGTIVGTFAYMAPEQALGRAPEPRSDLYSVGAMLYEMVTGRPPFVGDDPVAVVSQHINVAPVAPSWHNPEVPSDLEALILKLLAKIPDDRPPDAAAVREALAAIARSPRHEAQVRDQAQNPIARLAGHVFVGRAAEMDALRGDVVQTLAGRGCLVLVGGEPGIGKTSIAQEVATYARLASVQVLWGRCDDTGGAPPYWPWVQMIRSYIHDSSAANVETVMGSGAADIAQVVPEVARDSSPSSARPPIAPDQARFRLFDSIATFLRHAGKQQPLLLLIDDLHAADMPSLLLLQFVARQLGDMRVMAVATYRDVEIGRQHPLFHVLGELVREPVTRRVTLRGLSESDVGRYIELSAGPPAHGLAAAVFRETEGNPFFVGEIMRLLVAEGRLDTAPVGSVWRSELPQGVREAIGRRLDRLSAECNGVLRHAAVVGRDFRVSVLERVSETPRETILQLLEEALAARIITEATAGKYSFCHGLIRETLYGELSTTQRARLHHRVADTLETLYRLEPEAHLAELAYHFFQAANAGHGDKALHYSIRAGDEAARQMAHEEASRHYEMALQILDTTETTDGGRLVDVLLMLSEAAWRAGEVDQAKRASLRAIDLARHRGAAEQFARAALGFAGQLPVFGAVDPNPTVITLLGEALQGLDSCDTPLRALVMARLAEEQTLTEAHEKRWALSRQAVEMARRINDPMILASVLKWTFFAYWDPMGLEDRLSTSGEIIRLAEQVRDRTLGLEGHMFRFLGLVEKAEPAGAQRELEFCARVAKDLRQPYHTFVVAVLRGCLASMQGHLGEVEQLAQQALALGQKARAQNASMFCGVQVHRLMWLQGRFQELEPLVLGVVAAHPLVDASNRAALAITYAEQGRLHDARAQFEIAAAHDFADIPRHLGWQFTVAQLAEVCAALQDGRRAEHLYEFLRPLDGRNLLIPLLAILGPAAYYLGILATVLGRWEQAEGHFEDALQLDVKTGARQQHARTQVAYADMLLRRGENGDMRRALTHLEGACVVATELGMQRLAERASELMAKHQSRLGKASGPEQLVTAIDKLDLPDVPVVETTDPTTVFLRQEGEYWTLAHGRTLLRFKEVKGFHYLAHLLQNPGRELHALELVSARTGFGFTDRDPAPNENREPRALDLSGAGALLDEVAKTQYRNRVAALREQLAEAESFNDSGRADALRSEIDALCQQLTAAVGLSGRDRSPGSSAERARWAVTKAIRNVVTKISSGNPALGRHLAAQIHTGYVCSYRPDPDRPIRWVL